jgi:hypothetical protein
MRFILAPLVVLLGILMMRYTVQITNMTGPVDFAEKYLGGGLFAGTYTFYRLVGVAFCIIGAMWFFGVLGLLSGPLSSILGQKH